MFDLVSNNVLFRPHQLRLERPNVGGVVRIEVRELLQPQILSPFTALVVDPLGIPNSKYMAEGATFEEAVNQLLLRVQCVPAEELKKKPESASHPVA